MIFPDINKFFQNSQYFKNFDNVGIVVSKFEIIMNKYKNSKNQLKNDLINFIDVFIEYNVDEEYLEEYILFLIEKYSFKEIKELIENFNDDVYIKILSIPSIKLFFDENDDDTYFNYEHCTPEYYLEKNKIMDISTYEYGFGKNKRMDNFLSKLDAYRSLLDAKIKIGQNIRKYSKYTDNINKSFIDVCKVDNADNVYHFLEKGIDFNTRINAFKIACYYGNYEIVKILFKKEFDSKILDDAFSSSCKRGHYNVVKFLYENGANIKSNDISLSYLIIDGGYDDVLKFLIENISNIYLENDRIVSHCIKKCNNEIFKLLIDKEFDLETNNKDFLYLSIEYDNFYAFKYLMENGGDIYINCQGEYIEYNPLILSANIGRLKFVKFLVDNGSDIHIEDDKAIKESIRYHHVNVIEFLIKSDIDYFSEKSYVKDIVLGYKMIEFYEKFGISI